MHETFGFMLNLMFYLYNIIYYTDEVYVKVIDVLNRAKREVNESTNNAQLPLETDIEVTVNGGPMTLRVHRNDDVSPNAPVYMMRNGLIQKINLPTTRVKHLLIQ